MTNPASTIPFHQLSHAERRARVQQLDQATKTAIVAGMPVMAIAATLEVSPSDAALIREAIALEAGVTA